ncbi:ImmA/IrrE family metallo-endopeptidase [Pseudomonas sp. Irchel s3h14]|uniref:ImmA/IrrE family metallo-endopeptidase n=1 Tax=Pseudomonas sp. Irchel s3h14 TaxID=2009179 RepID=UPI000BA2C65B|nr:hypothetical protein [Pseudomonas sp. Irchel s3h14]
MRLAILLLSVLFGSSAIAVPEIPDPSLNDIAMVKPDPFYGAVIIYNPSICQQIGPACGFFRAHEIGHVFSGHHLLPPYAYNSQVEFQADCWAASNGIPYEIFAAYQLFLSGGSSANWNIYGNPQQRAARLKYCAQMAGRWIGPP